MANITKATTSFTNKGATAPATTLSSSASATIVKPKDGGWAAIARGGSSSKASATSAPISRTPVTSAYPVTKNNSAAAGSSSTNSKEMKIPSFNSEEVNKYMQSRFQEYYKLAKDAKVRHAEHEIAIFKPAESGWISNDGSHKKNSNKNAGSNVSSSGITATGSSSGKVLTYKFLNDLAKSL